MELLYLSSGSNCRSLQCFSKNVHRKHHFHDPVSHETLNLRHCDARDRDTGRSGQSCGTKCHENVMNWFGSLCAIVETALRTGYLEGVVIGSALLLSVLTRRKTASYCRAR